MSEERTLKKVVEEYHTVAHKAGMIQHELYSKQKDLTLLNQQMADLILEGTKLETAEAAAKKEEK